MTTPAVKRHVWRNNAVLPGLCEDCSAPPDAPQHLPAVELSEVGRNWHAQLLEIDRNIALVKGSVLAPLEKQREVALRNLIAEVGDAEAATIDGQPVVFYAWSKPGDGIDLAGLRRDHPAIYEAYYKAKAAARPFRAVAPE